MGMIYREGPRGVGSSTRDVVVGPMNDVLPSFLGTGGDRDRRIAYRGREEGEGGNRGREQGQG